MRPPSGDQEAMNSISSVLVRRTGGSPASEEIQMAGSPLVAIRWYARRSPAGESVGSIHQLVVPAGNIAGVTSGRSDPSPSCSQISGSPVPSVWYANFSTFRAHAGIPTGRCDEINVRIEASANDAETSLWSLVDSRKRICLPLGET